MRILSTRTRTRAKIEQTNKNHYIYLSHNENPSIELHGWPADTQARFMRLGHAQNLRKPKIA